MQGLYDYAVDNWLVWIIAIFAACKAIESVRDQKIGTAIWAVFLGGVASYVAKNPQTVFNWISTNIVGRFFG